MFFPQVWFESKIIDFYFPDRKRTGVAKSPLALRWRTLPCQTIDKLLYSAMRHAAQFLVYAFLLAGPLRYDEKSFKEAETFQPLHVVECILDAINIIVKAYKYIAITDSAQNDFTIYHDLIYYSCAIIMERFHDKYKQYILITALNEEQRKIRDSISCEITTAILSRHTVAAVKASEILGLLEIRYKI